MALAISPLATSILHFTLRPRRFTRIALFVEPVSSSTELAKCQLLISNCCTKTVDPRRTCRYTGLDFSDPQEPPLKVYRPTRRVLADVERLLAASRPSARHSGLEDVIDLLCRGRHYAWVGIFLAVGEGAPQQSLGAGRDAAAAEVALPETRSKILISIKLASRELGVLSVESERESAFGAEDRVLLEAVADSLARFLTGRGKYLARKARTDASRMGRAGTHV